MLLYKRDHHSEHNGAHVIVKNYISCHREHSLNWFLKSSTFCNITFGCCIKHPWPKIGLSQKLIFERIVHSETLAKWAAQILPTCVLLTLTMPHQILGRITPSKLFYTSSKRHPSIYQCGIKHVLVRPFLGTIYIP